jgi:hypothetical protein
MPLATYRAVAGRHSPVDDVTHPRSRSVSFPRAVAGSALPVRRPGAMSAVPDPASRGAALDELQLEFNLLDGLIVVGQGFVEQPEPEAPGCF